MAAAARNNNSNNNGAQRQPQQQNGATISATTTMIAPIHLTHRPTAPLAHTNRGPDARHHATN
eukprot:11068792-Lingulodinium_polyedra.AAC.1